MFKFLKRKNKPIGGYIGKFGLTDWWLSEFNESERNLIITKLVESRNLSLSRWTGVDKDYGDIWTEIDDEHPDDSYHADVIDALNSMCGFSTKTDNFHLSERFLIKAESYINEDTDIIKKNGFYGGKIGMYYRMRDLLPDALDIAIDACKKQISFAPQARLALIQEQCIENEESIEYVKYLIAAGAYPKSGLQEEIDSQIVRVDILHKGFTQLRIIEEKRKNFEVALELAKEALRQGWGGNWLKDIARLEKKINKANQSK